MAGLARKIKAGCKVLGHRLTGQYAPLEINIHITDRCNLTCTYCYSNFYKRHNNDIPFATICGIVDAFYELGVIEVSLIGGEPFLHPEFDRIVYYIKQKGLICSTVTNGYFLQNHISAVKKLDQVCVSLDGPEAINDFTRGPGSFRHAISALKLLREHKVNRSIRATLQKNNLDAIAQIMAIAVENDAMINLGLLFPQSSETGQEKTVSRETPPDEAYRRALRMVIALKQKYPQRFFNSLTNLRNALAWPASYKKWFLFKHELGGFPGFTPIPCFGGRTFATIDTDGRLYPCTNLIGNYDAPNVLSGDIKKAWRSIGSHTCSACFYLSSVEKNLLSGFNPDAVINLVRLGKFR